MNRTRSARSKTGCSTCRRRKVRCDETKPVCNACRRLALACSYELSRPANSSAALRYRVRFVEAHNTKPCLDEIKSDQPDATSTGPPQQHLALEAGCNREALEGNVGSRSNGHHYDVAQDNSIMPYRSPTETSTKDKAQLNASPKAVSRNGVFSPSSHLDSSHDQKDPGYVPAFFDLNMNFDLLGEDWLSPQTTGDEPPSEPEPRQTDTQESDFDVQGATVVIYPEDHRLIQHYLNVMTGYAKIRRSGDENIYSHIFSNMALFYAPLYNALMAWTALHLGQTKGEPDLIRKAEERYLYAVSLTHRDQNVALHLEISIVTIWFALQFELLAACGIDMFCRHLEFAADLVDAHRRHQRAGGEATPLGHIGCRMLVWLGAYDSRASCIGGTGRLLRILESFRLEYDFIDAAFPNFPGSTDDLKPCLRLSLELDYMESQIVHLNRRSIAAPVAIWSTVQSGLVTIRERLEGDPSMAPIIAYITNPTRSLAARITTKRFNSLLLLATFYGVVITFHRMLPAPAAIGGMPSKLMSAELAATYIIRLASWVCRFRPSSPQNIWPRLLFLAGIETTDLVYQDWAITALTEAEIWGANFHKTRLLLELIIKIQSTEGVRVDYLDVMKQDTGLFII